MGRGRYCFRFESVNRVGSRLAGFPEAETHAHAWSDCQRAGSGPSVDLVVISLVQKLINGDRQSASRLGPTTCRTLQKSVSRPAVKHHHFSHKTAALALTRPVARRPPHDSLTLATSRRPGQRWPTSLTGWRGSAWGHRGRSYRRTWGLGQLLGVVRVAQNLQLNANGNSDSV